MPVLSALKNCTILLPRVLFARTRTPSTVCSPYLASSFVLGERQGGFCTVRQASPPWGNVLALSRRHLLAFPVPYAAAVGQGPSGDHVKQALGGILGAEQLVFSYVGPLQHPVNKFVLKWVTKNTGCCLRRRGSGPSERCPGLAVSGVSLFSS